MGPIASQGEVLTDTFDVETSKDDKLLLPDNGSDINSDPKGEKTVKSFINQNRTIERLRSTSMFQVPITVGGFETRAVIDTGAEISIISDDVYKQLDNPPKVLKHVTLNAAGRNQLIESFVIGPIKLDLASKSYSGNIFVGPIEDDVLIGLDFLKANKAKLDISGESLTLQLREEKLSISTGKSFSTNTSTKVFVKKRTVVPPNSVARVSCRISDSMEMSNIVVESTLQNGLLIPRSVFNSSLNIKLCCVNTTDKNIILKRKTEVATASEAEEILDMDYGQDISEIFVNNLKCTETDSEIVPEHVKCLIEDAKEHLKQEEQLQFEKLFIEYSDVFAKNDFVEYSDVFAKNDFDLGCFKAIEHHIDTGSTKPIKQRFRKTPACFSNEEEAHLRKMLDAGVIEPSVSEWASAPVLIRKRDGGVRWCVDYRGLNSVTTKDVFPLPLIEECLDALTDNVWFSKLDANSAYWQVPVSETYRPKTAFSTKHGLFQFVKMGFGLCNAPATFARVMNLVLCGLTWDIVLAFLDDILVLGRTFDEHLRNLSHVFKRFRSYQLKLKPAKCIFFRKKVEFLGRTISENGIQPSGQHVGKIKDWPTPITSKEVEQFVGFANYHRSFIPDYANIAFPLYQLTGKNGLKWEDEHQQAFLQLKSSLTSPPVLAIPNGQDSFILDTDASDYAIGCELSQVQGDQERTVSYASFALTPEQRRYCTTRKELLAVVRCVRHFRHYLLGRTFTVRTDHNSLVWLLNFKNPQGQLARWLEELSQYDLVIKHRRGEDHQNADGLSRSEAKDQCDQYKHGQQPSTLPCGGCSYCVRAHEQWHQLISNVDEAVSLSSLPGVQTVTPVDDRDEFTIEVSTTGINILTYADHTNANIGVLDTQLLKYSTQEIKEAQEKDEDLSILLEFLKTGKEVDDGVLFSTNRAVKYYWINRPLYFLDENGILLRKEPRGGETSANYLVVPPSLREKAIALCHNIPASAHQGINRTEQMVKQRFHWYGLPRDVQKFVKSCIVCIHERNQIVKRIVL